MSHKFAKPAFILFSLFCILIIASIAHTHTPYRPEVIFSHPFPDRPISAFLAGRIGILSGEWVPSYRVVAFRYFAGRPLTRTEQKSFLAQANLNPEGALKAPVPNQWQREMQASPVRLWLRLRRQFTKTPPPSSTSGIEWWEYTDGENCQSGAFQMATATLRSRARHFGAYSPQLKDWLTGQDTVFLNCPAGEPAQKVAAIPAALPDSASPLLRADRDYQIAAAHFYAGHYAEAVKRFEAIAADPDSPWREWGSYLAARAVLRSGYPTDYIVAYDQENFDPGQLAEAEQRFTRVAAETTNPQIRRSALGLVSFIAFRLRPEEQTELVTRRVSLGQAGDRFGQDLEDFLVMLGKQSGTAPDFPGLEPYTRKYDDAVREWHNRRFAQLQEFRAAHELNDWMLTMECCAEPRRHHALEQWNAKKSVLWLVAGISLARGADPAVPALLLGAASVSPASPAYPTLLYHWARLLRERGEYSAARELLDKALSAPQDWTVSDINLLRSERFLLSTNLSEFARFSWSQPIAFSNGTVSKGEADYCDPDGWDVACDLNIFVDPGSRKFLPQFDVGSAAILNQQLPLAFLARLVHSPDLPQSLRDRMAPAVWARAAILDRPEVASDVSHLVVAARPELKLYTDYYQAANTPGERKVRAAYAIVHFPGLRPFVEGPSPRVTRFDYADNYRDNWWCNQDWIIEFADAPYNDSLLEKLHSLPSSLLLSAAEQRTAKQESRQLNAANPSGIYLSDILIDWAKTHRDDPHAPEALHYAWRALRFACDCFDTSTNQACGSTRRSKEAFLLLHKRYPDSPWTKKTRCWF